MPRTHFIELLEAASHKDCSPDCLEELFQAVSGHLLGYNGWLQAMPVLLKHLQLSPSDIAETHLAESSRRAAVASNAVVYRLAFLPDLYSEHRDLMHKAIPNLWMWFTHWLSIGYLSDEDVIIDTTALRNASVGMMVLCRSPEFVVPEASDVIIAFFIYSTRGLNLRRAMYRFTGSEEDTEPESESDDTRFRIYEPDNSIVCMLTLIRSCFNLSWAASSQSAAAADIYVALKPLFVPILTCTCIHISLRSSDHKGSYENKAKRVDGLNCLSIMASILERLTPGPSILPEKGLRSIVEHTLRAGLHASLMLSEHHDLQDRSDYAETLQLAFWILRLVFSTPLPAAVAISLVHHGIEKGILSTLAYTDEHIYEYGGSAKQLLRTSPCLEDRRFLLEEVLLSSMWMRPLFKDIIYELELHSTGLVKIRFALDERFEKLKMRWAIFYAQSSALSPSQGRHKRCGNTACAWSKKPPGRIQQCAGCESASYCDHFCQAASWRGDDHRSVCKAAMARRAAGLTLPLPIQLNFLELLLKQEVLHSMPDFSLELQQCIFAPGSILEARFTPSGARFSVGFAHPIAVRDPVLRELWGDVFGRVQDIRQALVLVRVVGGAGNFPRTPDGYMAYCAIERFQWIPLPL